MTRPSRWLRVALVCALGAVPLLLVTTVFAYGNFVSVTPQPAAPGQTLTVLTDSWETNAPLAFYWDGNADDADRHQHGHRRRPTRSRSPCRPAPNGSYDLAACEAPPGPQSGCLTTPSHYAVQVAAPATPPPATVAAGRRRRRCTCTSSTARRAPTPHATPPHPTATPRRRRRRPRRRRDGHPRRRGHAAPGRAWRRRRRRPAQPALVPVRPDVGAEEGGRHPGGGLHAARAGHRGWRPGRGERGGRGGRP